MCVFYKISYEIECKFIYLFTIIISTYSTASNI